MDLKKIERLNKEKKLIEYGDKIIIAMSGGPDSVFLYNLLKKIKDEMDLKVYFAHINHGLRGKDSDGDEKFVIELGESEKVPTYTKKVDIKEYAKLHGLSEEEAGREVRYGFFRELKDRLGATKVALAHNEDDLVETFMFRLIRGTSFKGLEGIPVMREFFIRPVLNYRKEDILKHLDENKICYCIDKTNFENIYTRNKIRLDLIPSIEKEYNVNFKEKIINLISDIGEFNGIINSSLKKYTKNDILDVRELKKEENFIQRTIISEYLQKFDISVNRNKILEVQKLIYADGSKEIYGNYRYRIKKKYDILEIVEVGKIKLNNQLIEKLNVPGSVLWNNYKISAQLINEDEKFKEGKNEFYCKLRKDDILTVRSRKNGDKFYPVGMSGRKKLKDLFINSKVPKEERDFIPIITNLDEILWVGGIRGDRRFEDLKKNTAKLKIEKIEGVDFGGK
ncbi:tRNA lysidine(34) synthetase TilS [Psychrilyobacter sp.]|uniref:tRNA lysidine(34) synthetase TilS n=1 Tax=Psychrilyobacter sp. TaxID=2586924 RepID=UPI003016010C